MTETASFSAQNFNEWGGALSLPPALNRFEITSSEYGSEVIINPEYELIARQLGVQSLNNLTKVENIEDDSYAELREDVKSVIIGQDRAVDEFMDTLMSAELCDPNRPVGSFLFLGPTGVGKTELTKEMNRRLHDEDDLGMLRIDCSDYVHGHNVARLVGSPPGYAGRNQEAVFSQKNVDGVLKFILFDEIEKAHPDLLKLLLQILEEGELSINDGTTTSFRNTLIVMTSNVGAHRMQQELSGKKLGFATGPSPAADSDKLDSIVEGVAKETFPPEFYNRIDKKIVFQPLSDEQFKLVLHSHIDRLNKRILSKGVVISATDELLGALVENTQDRREFGGRRMVRQFDRTVKDLVARGLMTGSIERGSHVHAYLDESRKTDGKTLPVGLVRGRHEGALEAYLKTKIKYIHRHIDNSAKDFEDEDDYSTL